MTIERAILEALNLVHPRMLTEGTLLGDVRMDLPETSKSELKLKIRILEGKDQIVVIPGEDVTRIKITAAGQARLLE
jgi:hypothetical protein